MFVAGDGGVLVRGWGLWLGMGVVEGDGGCGWGWGLWQGMGVVSGDGSCG